MELNVAFHFVFEKLSVCLLDLRVYAFLEISQSQYCGENASDLYLIFTWLSNPKSMFHSKMSSCAMISPLHTGGLEQLKALSLLTIFKKEKSPRRADSQAVLMAGVLHGQRLQFTTW